MILNVCYEFGSIVETNITTVDVQSRHPECIPAVGFLLLLAASVLGVEGVEPTVLKPSLGDCTFHSIGFFFFFLSNNQYSCIEKGELNTAFVSFCQAGV